MIIPIGTDNKLQQTPLVNYALIAINFLIFFLINLPGYIDSPEVRPFLLHPSAPKLFQFVSYGFLHGGTMHIIGNMLFLYIFGNNVNDKLGHLGYLLLYLGGVIFSGVGHAILDTNPVLGASGAVAAVTGAYMVLFPKTNILVLYIIFFIGTIEVPALYFILFKLIIYDNMVEPSLAGMGNIAYHAHLAGYVFGIGVPLIMLSLKLLPNSQFDLWALIARWRRRTQYRRVVNQGYDAYAPQHRVRVDNVKVKDSQPIRNNASPDVHDLRGRITEHLNKSELDKAAEAYLELIGVDKNQVLSPQQQLDIANRLMQKENHQAAATAYESFLKYYAQTYPFVEQIELMLGLIYSRYLNQPEAAVRHMEAAMKKLSDAGQRQMCQAELDSLKQS